MKNKSLLIQLTIFSVVAVALIIFGSAKNSQSSDVEGGVAKPKADKIEIMYFHATARCPSCIALEEYVKETVDEFFQEEIASGKINFQEINVDLSENKDLSLKFKAVGSSLKINEIYGGADHIEEDVRVWRYLSDKDSFKNYLKNRIESRLK